MQAMEPKELSRGPMLRTADRALELLRIVGETPNGVTAKDAALRMGLTLSTAYRLFGTLQRQGFVRATGHRYLLGPTAASLGRAIHDQLAPPAPVRQELTRLHDLLHVPVYLTVFHGEDIVISYIADSASRPRIRELDIGFAEVAHTTAFGKLMLASYDDVRLADYLDRHGLPAVTGASLTNQHRLHDQLVRIRHDQLAVEVEEYTRHLACLAVPVRSRTGQTIGAVSVSLRARELAVRTAELSRAVRQTAGRIGRY